MDAFPVRVCEKKKLAVVMYVNSNFMCILNDLLNLWYILIKICLHISNILNWFCSYLVNVFFFLLLLPFHDPKLIQLKGMLNFQCPYPSILLLQHVAKELQHKLTQDTIVVILDIGLTYSWGNNTFSTNVWHSCLDTKRWRVRNDNLHWMLFRFCLIEIWKKDSEWKGFVIYIFH